MVFIKHKHGKYKRDISLIYLLSVYVCVCLRAYTHTHTRIWYTYKSFLLLANYSAIVNVIRNGIKFIPGITDLSFIHFLSLSGSTLQRSSFLARWARGVAKSGLLDTGRWAWQGREGIGFHEYYTVSQRKQKKKLWQSFSQQGFFFIVNDQPLIFPHRLEIHGN